MTPKEKAEQLARIIHENYCAEGLQALTIIAIDRAIIAAVEEEREECAVIADDATVGDGSTHRHRRFAVASEIRDAIRARLNPDPS